MLKRKLKLILDVVMYVLFIILMGYHITGSKIHEILGVITFLIFIIHNVINYKWYKTIFKGKYTLFRRIQVISNILLLISLTGMIVSGVMISGHVFSFLNLKTTMFGRELHMVSTSWGFILMSIHLGFHIGILIRKLNKKMKNSMFEYIYYLIVFLICAFGIYSFIKTKIWNDMFLIIKFKFFDMNQSLWIFYLEHLAISIVISLMTYELIKISRNKKERNK